jgi:LEA14-like dessication related protein
MPRFAAHGRILALCMAVLVAGCATLGLAQPVSVNIVGIEPLPSEAMEGRFAVRLRVQNPNEQPVDYDGISLDLAVRGAMLARGVSDQQGTIPRFGETVITVPVSVPVSALLRQALGVAAADTLRTDYELRGRLAGPGIGGGVRFDSRGAFSFPQAWVTSPDPTRMTK